MQPPVVTFNGRNRRHLLSQAGIHLPQPQRDVMLDLANRNQHFGIAFNQALVRTSEYRNCR